MVIKTWLLRQSIFCRILHFISRITWLNLLIVSQAFKQRLIEPTTFWEAYNHPNPEMCAKWQATIQKEFHNMN